MIYMILLSRILIFAKATHDGDYDDTPKTRDVHVGVS